MNHIKGQHLTKWILILPIIVFIVTALSYIQTFVNHEKESYENDLRQNNTETLKRNKLLAKEKVEEIFTFIKLNTKQLKQQAKEETKEMIGLAYNIIEKVYKENPTLSRNEVIALINEKLKEMRFFRSLNGYFYLMDMNGICLMHPIDSTLVGKNLLPLQDTQGQFFIKKGIDLLEKNGETPISYYWRKGTNKKIVKKYAYMKKFEPLGIFVVTGRYEDNILNDIKKSIQEMLINVRYGEKGYMFAYNGEGTTISHIRKDFIGVNRWDEVIHDEHLIQELIKGAKYNPEGFFKSYIARFDPLTKKEAYKISYLKYVPELDWIIGTGVYISDVQEQLREKERYLEKSFKETISELVYISIILLLVILVATYFIFSKLRKVLQEYQNSLIEYNLETTSQKEELVFQLRHDTLTSLPNRILLTETFTNAVYRAKRHDKKIAIIFMDIDNFKEVNDTYGHSVGDMILKTFAESITKVIRKSDLASRLSGDEFVLLLEDIETTNSISKVIINIKKELSKPIYIQKKAYFVQTSIGVSIYPSDGENLEVLVKNADSAMYVSKKNGKNQYTFYDKSNN